ncbi:MAG TPA: DUF4038 domain-containing protein [Sedimentisphaerales bacterium]|nr:DUF4038 domain-containing protein [Sedimentisphaerales bacterium]
MRRTAVLLIVFATSSVLFASPAGVSFTQSSDCVECYDFVEITARIDQPDVGNPFTDARVEGRFFIAGGPPLTVDGFCDAVDGSVFRIRFMPAQAGEYRYSVTYRQGTYEVSHAGEFKAQDHKRRGLIRVDKEHPWHFLWEGTGEHFFWNGTTTYWLLGWDDETIRGSIDRLARLKVNRLRVAINGRVKDGRAWFENVFPTEKFSFLMNPWVAQRPDSVENPGFDVTRFNLPHWEKIERLLRHARERDMTISIIFYVDGARPGVDPFGKARMGGEDEQRYYRYAIARLAAFSNVMWDVTNEYHLFRNEEWTDKMGAFLKQCDPYDHVTSVHGHGQFPFRASEWVDFAMYQSWDESGGYRFMLNNRTEQQKIGRPMPQINEEYGYEDHYPTWGGGRQAPARSADNRRRLAWGMYMAGGYQTTGERADTGTGWGPDTGGGWINGRGDDSMTMLEGYGHIVDFFTALPWWKLEPDNGFFEVPSQSVVRTEPTHVVYTRDSQGKATLYVDGEPVSTKDVTGDLSNWDDGFRLALGNELTGDRPWLGELHRIAVYARVLGPGEIGRDKSPTGAVALYDFREGAGDVVKDTSGSGVPLDLKVKDASAVRWLPGGGLRIVGSAGIASPEPAARLIQAVKQSNAITIEAWIKPANTTQAGPARIVTLSKDTSARNFTLGQKAGAYEVRLRTTTTSPNGEPSLSSPGGEESTPSVVGQRTPAGDLAVLYFAAGGSATIKPGSLKGNFQAKWFNPRTGQYSSAKPDSQGRFTAPDKEDWTLLLGSSGAAQRAVVRFKTTTADGVTIEGLGTDNPLIYDNDWWFDTPDKDYLWAKASLGQANLRGNIVTRDLWDWQKGYLYKLQQGMDDAGKSVGIARRSGLKGIPDPVPGCDRAFERPASGYIRDTKIVPSEGSELIVAEARKATPDKPLVVFVGGPLNTVANAYLMDPSIADRMVVFMTDLCGYNGKDPWANYIVATRCKLVNYGAHIWWPQRPEPPVMPLERFAELPQNEMTADLYRMAKWFWDRSTKKDKPDRDDGFADGAPIFYFFNHKVWLDVQPQRVVGVFNVQDTSGMPYDLLDVRELDYKQMTEDFFRVLKDPAVYGR